MVVIVPRWGARLRRVLRPYEDGVGADPEIGVPGQPKSAAGNGCARKKTQEHRPFAAQGKQEWLCHEKQEPARMPALQGYE
jgi:hypothetical protein